MKTCKILYKDLSFFANLFFLCPIFITSCTSTAVSLKKRAANAETPTSADKEGGGQRDMSIAQQKEKDDASKNNIDLIEDYRSSNQDDSIQELDKEKGNIYLSEGQKSSIDDIEGSIDLSASTISPDVKDSLKKDMDKEDDIASVKFKGKSHIIVIKDGATAFTPRRLKINVGDTVRWENRDSTIDAHLFQSVPEKIFNEKGSDEIALVDLYEGKSYEHTFKEIGIYPYFCFVHKGMTGIIAVVREGQTISEMKAELDAIIAKRQRRFIRGGKREKLLAKEMVLVEGGKFILGSPEEGTEGPVSLEYLPAFYIDKYEVTNEEYEEFVNITGYKSEGKWKRIYISGNEKHPVTNVTYNDAAAYAKWANKRLPTEQEWEKAARGKDNRMWPWGDEFDNEITNVFGPDDFMGTSPVGYFNEDVSPYGLYDMAGNVSEWTSSIYLPYKDSPEPDYPDFSPKKMVVRGGSFNTVYEEQARTHSRTGRTPSLPSISIGFRLVKDAAAD